LWKLFFYASGMYGRTIKNQNAKLHLYYMQQITHKTHTHTHTDTVHIHTHTQTKYRDISKLS